MCTVKDLTWFVSHKTKPDLCEKKNSYSDTNTFDNDRGNAENLLVKHVASWVKCSYLKICPHTQIPFQIHLMLHVWSKDEHERGLPTWQKQNSWCPPSVRIISSIFCFSHEFIFQNLSCGSKTNHCSRDGAEQKLLTEPSYIPGTEQQICTETAWKATLALPGKLWWIWFHWPKLLSPFGQEHLPWSSW